jgi:hypothetical protein
MPRVIEAIYLGFEPYTSAYLFLILEKNTRMSSNQAQFEKTVFPIQTKEMIEEFQSLTKQLIF